MVHLQVHLNIIWVKACRVIDGGIPLDNSDDFGSSSMREFSEVVTDVSESLHDYPLSLDAVSEVIFVAEGIRVEKFPQDIKDPEARRLGPPRNSALSRQLSCGRALMINISFPEQVLIRVLNPGHDLIIRAHIRPQNIRPRSNKTFLGELHRVLTRNPFYFPLRIFLRVEPDSAFGTSERDSGDQQLEGHQGC